uniref:Coiled-coil domain-containing protein 87-like n=1 Tax=Phallusia mammillata TaxID=59560 RepID=A0A6F9D7Y0_9ASCI|nr:coiled-coil domain-containing protein 87-like [Phallusia mammillata]
MDNDPMVIKPTEEVNLSQVLASSSLVRPRSQQIINPDLTKFGLRPPWGEEDQTVWEKKDRPALSARESASTRSRLPSHFASAEKPSRAYASWLAWWKATITTDDYLKFLSTQETDFLGVIFHFYDSEASESIADSESKHAKLEEERKREKLLGEIKAKKEHFIRGVWNANSVLLGGLGKYPDLQEYEEATKAEEEEEDMGAGDGEHSRPDAFLLSPRDFPNSVSASDDRSTSQAFSPTLKSLSQPDKSTVATSEGQSQPPQQPLQSRLETVWKKLRMSGGQKLDAALKYSSDQYLPLLEASVTAWERVTELILKREKTLHDLETFERDASDPTRFFQRGSRGSSSTRLREAKSRSRLYQRLEGYEKIISGMLQSVHAQFNDVITFGGRAYQDKMAWDKIEMLYWLQQERRCQMLSDHGYPQQLRQFIHENNTSAAVKPITRVPAPVPINNVTID